MGNAHATQVEHLSTATNNHNMPSNFQRPMKAAALEKRGQRGLTKSKWRKRYCELFGETCQLRYYLNQNREPVVRGTGVIDLQRASLVRLGRSANKRSSAASIDTPGRPDSFTSSGTAGTIKPDSVENGEFEIVTNDGRTWQLRVCAGPKRSVKSAAEEAREWVEAIAAVMNSYQGSLTASPLLDKSRSLRVSAIADTTPSTRTEGSTAGRPQNSFASDAVSNADAASQINARDLMPAFAAMGLGRSDADECTAVLNRERVTPQMLSIIDDAALEKIGITLIGHRLGLRRYQAFLNAMAEQGGEASVRPDLSHHDTRVSSDSEIKLNDNLLQHIMQHTSGAAPVRSHALTVTTALRQKQALLRQERRSVASVNVAEAPVSTIGGTFGKPPARAPPTIPESPPSQRPNTAGQHESYFFEETTDDSAIDFTFTLESAASSARSSLVLGKETKRLLDELRYDDVCDRATVEDLLQFQLNNACAVSRILELMRSALKLSAEPVSESAGEVMIFNKLRADIANFASVRDNRLHLSAKRLANAHDLETDSLNILQLNAHYADQRFAVTPEENQLFFNGKLTEGVVSVGLSAEAWRVRVLLAAPTLAAANRMLGRCLDAPSTPGFRYNGWHLGLIHPVVCVGGTVLEWGPASVCVPTPIDQWHSENVSVCLNVFSSKTASTFVSDRQLIKSLCQTIAEWNTQKFYTVFDDNPQHFVDACLVALQLPAVFDGKMGECMQLIKFGNADSAGKLEQRTLFPLSLGDHTFSSHAELDLYVTHKQSELGRDDLVLFEFFDRVSWLRWHALDEMFDDSKDVLAADELQELDVCAPNVSERQHLCAFGIPPFMGAPMY